MKKICLAASLALLLAGCSSIKVWPFGEENSATMVRTGSPANATEYQCQGGRRFHVRMLDHGATAWLIYPDREVALAKVAEGRYGGGSAVLEMGAGEAKLSDGAVVYSGCKPASK